MHRSTGVLNLKWAADKLQQKHPIYSFSLPGVDADMFVPVQTVQNSNLPKNFVQIWPNMFGYIRTGHIRFGHIYVEHALFRLSHVVADLDTQKFIKWLEFESRNYNLNFLNLIYKFIKLFKNFLMNKILFQLKIYLFGQ